MRANLTRFKQEWRERLDSWSEQGQGGIEKKYAQSFWAELCAAFGVSATRMDLFEQDARRASSGKGGYIDLFWPGVVIGEAKSPGKDLGKAVDQARDYLQGGSVTDAEQPTYIIASDFETFRLLRLGAPEHRYDITFPLAEIDDHVDQLRFFAGYQDVTPEEQEAASIKASQLMADLFTAMVGDDADEEVGDEAPTNPEDEDEAVQETSMYLTRLLFLLFGDDAGLWEQDLFYRFVLDHTTPDTLGSQLEALFQVLNTPEASRSKRLPKALARFPYVNGAIFAESMPMKYFNPVMRDALINACRFQWTQISPAIFGSLFQLVKSKEARRSDGEHYTSEKNILKTIGPLFLAELRAEADRLISAKSTPVAKLRQFRDRLATHLFCDPACGSGNFLVVAYRELRAIETDVIVAIRQREGLTGMALDITWEQKLSINQFHGFELNWWPARIAETAMFLVDHQANRELAAKVGQAPDRLPITITAHIHHGNALQMDWAKALPQVIGETYIFGNPPFRGDARDRAQLEDLKAAWGKRTKSISRLDFVTGWHAKALDLFGERAGRFAYVTTNSITQGDQVPRLFGAIFAEGWRIRFAHRTFAWDSEAPGKAAVHCVIVGFDRCHEPRAVLWDYKHIKDEPTQVNVEQAINAYLVDGPNVLVEKAQNPITRDVERAAYGSKPTDGGNLIVEVDEYDEVHSDKVAAKYLRPFMMGRELVRGLDRWCLWLVDLDPNDLERSPVLRQRVRAVKEFRERSKAASTREYAKFPHLFRQIGQPNVRFVAVPKVVSSARLYYTVDYLSPDVIVGDKIFAVPDADGLQFALLSSSMFITWQKTVGGRLKSDVSFGSTLTWHTFPLPTLDESHHERIVAAGAGILRARSQQSGRSLAQMYNPLAMDPDLVKAHDELDREVDKAFGADRKLTTERQRQELLFENYLKLTSTE